MPRTSVVGVSVLRVLESNLDSFGRSSALHSVPNTDYGVLRKDHNDDDDRGLCNNLTEK